MAKKNRESNISYLEDDDTSMEYYDPNESRKTSHSANAKGQFLGMTAPQRFVIVLILFLMTCVLGTFCLILSGKVWPPFF